MGDCDDDNSHRGNSNEREVELLTMRNLMRNESGRDFMWRCLQQACIFSNTYTDDPLRHAYLAGGREMGLWIDKELKEAAPDEYLLMMKEHFDG